MRMTDVKMCETIRDHVIQDLRNLGVKHRAKRSHRKCQEVFLNEAYLFKRPLQLLPLITVHLDNTSSFEVPEIVYKLCSFIYSSLQTEGIFRKAGSGARQKQIKASLEANCNLSKEHNVIDVANVLKLFFRELPEPLIPYIFHDTFLQSLIIRKEEVVNGLLLTCLLLPDLHLNTLFYYLKFLRHVISYSNYNKMDIKNIAIIMTPTIMPIEEKVMTYTTQRLNHHVQVVQLLLENAEQIGELPPRIVQSLHFSQLKRQDKYLTNKNKKRSGSLTRMFNGFKKMVSSKSMENESNPKGLNSATPDLLLTPCLTRSSGKKRKVVQTAGFSGKRRKQLMESLPQTSALISTPFKSGTTPTNFRQYATNIHTPIVYPLELKIGPPEETEFVRIPKTEYEEIKNRVSAIENRISQEFNSVEATTSSHVQTVYEKTLEEAELLNNSTSEHLAKKLSRELKIRRSSEHKVIRSPSARKIEILRRRSQEYAAKVVRTPTYNIPKVNLKRGQPNTILSGLPQPSPYKALDVARASPFCECTAMKTQFTKLEKWASAELYFTNSQITPSNEGVTHQRDSLTKLRSQNVGMVSAKAKLFNDLSGNSDNKIFDNKYEAKCLRKAGSFPRQTPVYRRRVVFDSLTDKENDPLQFGNWESSVTQRNNLSTKSPRRTNSVRVLH